MREVNHKRQDRGVAPGKMDQRDVGEVLGGEKDAYARVVLRHRHRVAACMRRFTRDDGVLDELVHEAFVEAYLSLPSYAHRGPFSRWLLRIATRVGYRHWTRLERERRTRRALAAEYAGRRGGPEALPHSEAGERLLQLLKELNPDDQRVLNLKYFEGRTSLEIAASTGWSQGLVRVRAHRARRRLRRLLEADILRGTVLAPRRRVARGGAAQK